MAKKAGVVTIDFNAGTLSLLKELDTANTKLKQFGKNAESSGLSFRYAFNGVKDIMEGRVNNAIAEGANELARLRGAALAVGGATAGIVAIGVAAYEAKKHFDELAEMPAKLRAQFGELNLKQTNDDLALSNARLESDIAKLQGKPQNGLKVALEEAKVAADKLADALDKDLGKIASLLKEETRGGFNAFVHGEAATADIRKELVGETGYGGFRAKLAGAEGDPKRAAGLLDEEIGKLGAMGAEERIAEQTGQNILNHQKRIELINQALEMLMEERKRIDQTEQNTALTGKKTTLEAEKQNSQQRIQIIKSGYDEALALMESREELAADQKADFRRAELAVMKAYGKESAEIQRELEIEIGNLDQQTFKDRKSMADESLRLQIQYQEEDLATRTEWARRAQEANTRANRSLSEKPTELRADIPQIEILGNARTRMQGTPVGNQLAIRDAGYATLQEQSEAIENEKRLLNAMEQGNYSLAERLQVQDKILQMQIALRRETTAEAEQDQILTDMIQERLRVGSIRAGWQAFFLEMERRAKQPGQILYEGLSSALDRLSENIAQFITGGKANFGQMFRDIGRQMVSESVRSTLQRGLGAVGRKLGIDLGMKLDGQTEATAKWVRIAGGYQPVNRATGALDGILNRNRGLFSGSLGGGVFNFAGGNALAGVGGPNGSAVNPFYVIPEGGQVASNAPSGWASVFQNLGLAISAGGPKIAGGRAGGGYVSPGEAYTVAENGFEILTGARGYVHNNAESRKMLGGETHNYYINAAPGVSREEMFQAVTAAHRASVSTSVQANVEFTKRTPQK